MNLDLLALYCHFPGQGSMFSLLELEDVCWRLGGGISENSWCQKLHIRYAYALNSVEFPLPLVLTSTRCFKSMREEFLNNTSCPKNTSYVLASLFSGRFDLWKRFYHSICTETYGAFVACRSSEKAPVTSPGLVLPFWSKKRMKLLGTLGEGAQRQVPQGIKNESVAWAPLTLDDPGSILQDICHNGFPKLWC